MTDTSMQRTHAEFVSTFENGGEALIEVAFHHVLVDLGYDHKKTKQPLQTLILHASLLEKKREKTSYL